MSNAKAQTLASLDWGSALRYRKHYGASSGSGLASISDRGSLQSIVPPNSQAIVTAKALEMWLAKAFAGTDDLLCFYHGDYCLHDELGTSVIVAEPAADAAERLFADTRFVSCQHYLQGSYGTSPASLASRNVNSGVLVDLQFREPVRDRLVTLESSPVTWVLDQIQRDLTERGAAAEWFPILDRLVDDAEDAQLSAFRWLQQDARHPRLIWYCLQLLQSHGVSGLDQFALDLLKHDKKTEAAVGAAIVLRGIETRSDRYGEAAGTILGILDSFDQRPFLLEESVDEMLLAESIETASVIGNETFFPRFATFWCRRWSFKVRIRALAAAQLLVVRYADSRKIDEAISNTLRQLEEMILALLESFNISNTSRALTYKAIDLLLARLGPEMDNVMKIGERVPELQRRIARSAKSAEAALIARGKQDWLARRHQHLLGLESFQ